MSSLETMNSYANASVVEREMMRHVLVRGWVAAALDRYAMDLY